MPPPQTPFLVLASDGKTAHPAPIPKRLLALYGGFTLQYVEAEIANGSLRATIFSPDDTRIQWPDLLDWLASKENRPRKLPLRRPRDLGPFKGGEIRVR